MIKAIEENLQIDIIKHYGTKDIKFLGECNTDLEVNLVKIFSGDEYHNQINTKIDGFLLCLDYLEIPYTKCITRLNDEPDWDD